MLTKFLQLGLSIDEVLARITSVPAEAIVLQDQIGTLRPGAWGDAVVFELREGEYSLADSYGDTRVGRQRIEPVMVVKGGRIYRDARQGA